MLHFPPCLLLLLKLSSLEFIVSSNYSKPDKYFINCGSFSNTDISDDRIFGGVLNHLSSLAFGKSKVIKDPDPSNTTPFLYCTARVSHDRFSTIYNSPATTGRTWYQPLRRIFDVSASGVSLLSNFSVGERTSAVLIEEFPITIGYEFSAYALCHLMNHHLLLV